MDKILRLSLHWCQVKACVKHETLFNVAHHSWAEENLYCRFPFPSSSFSSLFKAGTMMQNLRYFSHTDQKTPANSRPQIQHALIKYVACGCRLLVAELFLIKKTWILFSKLIILRQMGTCLTMFSTSIAKLKTLAVTAVERMKTGSSGIWGLSREPPVGFSLSYG